MKRIISFALCLIIALSLVPFSVFAANIIDNVNVFNIEKPIAGKMWQWGEATVASSDNYTVAREEEWYDETDEKFLVNNETFKVGHVYTVHVYLDAKDGYEFATKDAVTPDVTATICGQTAKVSKAYEYQPWYRIHVTCTFPAVKENKKIDRVVISDVIAPKIGRQSVYNPRALTHSEGVKITDVYWSVGKNWNTEFTGVFAEKTEYSISVTMEAEEGYQFNFKENGMPDVLATINGEAAHNVMFDGEGRLVARLTFDNLGEEKPKVTGIITYFVNEPVIGEKPSYEAVNQRDDRLYELDTDDPKATKNGITWTEGVGDNSRVMGEDETFKPNTYYHVTISVKPIKGYLFDMYSDGDFALVGAINNQDAIYGGTEESAFIGYTFQTPENKEERTVISEVEAVSNYSDILFVGGKASAPQFNVVKGTPAKIKFTGYQIKNEKGEFVELPIGSVFTDTPIRILGQLIVEGDANKDYVLHKDVKLIVDGVEWFMGNVGFYDDHSACWVTSMPITPSPKKEEEKPTETPSESPTETPADKPTETPEDNKVTFTDVPSSAYYYEPVMWAAENGITGGTAPGKFSPDNVCTRAQVVTFLWRAAGSPEPKSSTNPFTDVKSSDYFYKAVLWAVENNITGGTGNGKFSPDDNCIRAQVVTFLHRAAKSPEPKSSTNPFVDVAETEYYYKPVLWAVENNITGGTGNGKFSPSGACTRAQVVTFLYRYMGK